VKAHNFLNLSETITINTMKKYFLLLTILFSSSLFSQLITYTSVRLDEGQNEDYIKIEDFWSKIHESTIAQDLATGWMIWEVIKEEGDEKASSRPDFLIMNFYKDSIQKNKPRNFYEIGRAAYPKLSKKKFDKIWEGGPYGERNIYELERLDNTNWIFGELEIGTVIQFNAFKQLDDSYERYEMEFYKKWHEKGILNGARKWWEFNKILSRNLNTVTSLEDEPTHITIDIYGREIPEAEWEDAWGTPTFMDQMMWNNGSKTREMLDQANLKLVMYRSAN
jgi:hypothetical protein